MKDGANKKNMEKPHWKTQPVLSRSSNIKTVSPKVMKNLSFTEGKRLGKNRTCVTCIPGHNYMYTWSQLHVYLVTITCIPGHNYMYTWSQLHVYLVTITCIPGHNYMYCTSILHHNVAEKTS